MKKILEEKPANEADGDTSSEILASESAKWHSALDSRGSIDAKMYARLQGIGSAIRGADAEKLVTSEFLKGALKTLDDAVGIVLSWHHRVEDPLEVSVKSGPFDATVTAAYANGPNREFKWNGSRWSRNGKQIVPRLQVALESGRPVSYIQGIEDVASEFMHRQSFSGSSTSPKTPGEFINLVSAASVAGLTEIRMSQLVRSRSVPHYYFPFDDQPYFKLEEIKDWVNKSATRIDAIEMLPKIKIVPTPDVSAKLTMDIPESIRHIDGLREALVYDDVCGIYFLCDDNEVVYIGQSTNIFGRIAQHRLQDRKDFGRIFYFTCREQHLDRTEREMIDKLLPKYNSDQATRNRRLKVSKENPTQAAA